MLTSVRAILLLALSSATLAACSDRAPDPLSAAPSGSTPARTVLGPDVWNIADVEADFPGLYSLDTTQAGLAATPYVAPADATSGDRDFCRDHFKPIDLWWDGGRGLMRFHLDPPLLFVGYRPGTFRSPRNLVFRKAVFETTQESEATDPVGNVWRFKGRFNALCRGGSLEIGPIVFGGQVLVSQDPLDLPRLVRSGSGGDREGCGGGGGGGEEWYTMESYDPYAEYDPAPSPDDELSLNCGGGGAAGGGAGFDPNDFSCTWEYITIEITRDGEIWEHYWSGWAQVCEELEE